MNNKQAFIKQDEISHYLRDVRKITVMTPDREKELAKIIANPESTQEEIEKVNNELIYGNLRFVISVAKNYQNQGVDLPDLIAEGN